MPYALFHDRFPKLAEARSIMVFDDPELPKDHYALMEMYCDVPGCDCRRVMFHVFAESRKEFVGTIAWGWESKKFYRKWMKHYDPEALHDLKGPVLNRLSPQSDFAPILLERIKNIVLKDEAYVNRIKRHYKLFREAIEMEMEKGADEPIGNNQVKVGRNDPCPCGSGKKYKHCCIN